MQKLWLVLQNLCLQVGKSRMTKYVINKKFQTRVERSARVLEIAEAFGLGLDDREFVIFNELELEVIDGDVVYITGQSGAGKTVLLRELASQMKLGGLNVMNIDDVQFEDKPLIDQIGKDLNEAMKYLSIAGLNDAYLFVRKPTELSDGQKYRFRLAKLIESNATVWVADEFMAILDRVSAAAISFNIQKVARSLGITLLVATTHTDLVEDLAPTLYIDKRFREKLKIKVLEDGEYKETVSV